MSTDDEHDGAAATGPGAAEGTPTGSPAGDPAPEGRPPAASPGGAASPTGTASPTGAASPGGAASARPRRRVDLASGTRTARAWWAWIIGAIVLIFLLVFIIQNSDSADFQIFTWHFSLPLGVAILLAAIIGALITALLGGARMLQMRRAARKHRP